jgi:CarD family transcriptional regulator
MTMEAQTQTVSVSVRFEPGDVAVHPAHGLGEIVAIEHKDAGGQRVAFYVLKIRESGAKVMVAVNAAATVGLRPVMSAKAAADVLDILRAHEVATTAQPWTRRHRIYTEMLKSGAPDAIAKVLRDMSRLRHDKDLSFAERKLLDQAKGLLIGELSAATGTPRGAMEKDIEAFFAKGA